LGSKKRGTEERSKHETLNNQFENEEDEDYELSSKEKKEDT
jgi:hypothetical protein